MALVLEEGVVEVVEVPEPCKVEELREVRHMVVQLEQELAQEQPPQQPQERMKLVYLLEAVHLYQALVQAVVETVFGVVFEQHYNREHQLIL